jgi:hypothetical protein
MSKLPAVTNRLLDVSAEILGEPDPKDLSFLHVVLAQCGLPYRNPVGLPFYGRKNGRAQLAITPGVLRNPKTGDMEMQGIPYGAKARLLVIHLCTQAVLLQSAIIPVQDSMSAFMKHGLGLAVTGGTQGSIGRFKDQLNRLAASRIQLFLTYETPAGRGESMMNPAPMIASQELWFPKNPEQRVLWPSTVTLSNEFFQALQRHSLPLDPRAVQALQHSAMALDCYTWAAHRLPRVKSANGETISWAALKNQFGQDFNREQDFRRKFNETLRHVLAVYPTARIESDASGFNIRKSPPPILPKALRG